MTQLEGGDKTWSVLHRQRPFHDVDIVACLDLQDRSANFCLRTLTCPRNLSQSIHIVSSAAERSPIKSSADTWGRPRAELLTQVAHASAVGPHSGVSVKTGGVRIKSPARLPRTIPTLQAYATFVSRDARGIRREFERPPCSTFVW